MKQIFLRFLKSEWRALLFLITLAIVLVSIFVYADWSSTWNWLYKPAKDFVVADILIIGMILSFWFNSSKKS